MTAINLDHHSRRLAHADTTVACAAVSTPLLGLCAYYFCWRSWTALAILLVLCVVVAASVAIALWGRMAARHVCGVWLQPRHRRLAVRWVAIWWSALVGWVLMMPVAWPGDLPEQVHPVKKMLESIDAKLATCSKDFSQIEQQGWAKVQPFDVWVVTALKDQEEGVRAHVKEVEEALDALSKKVQTNRAPSRGLFEDAGLRRDIKEARNKIGEIVTAMKAICGSSSDQVSGDVSVGGRLAELASDCHYFAGEEDRGRREQAVAAAPSKMKEFKENNYLAMSLLILRFGRADKSLLQSIKDKVDVFTGFDGDPSAFLTFFKSRPLFKIPARSEKRQSLLSLVTDGQRASDALMLVACTTMPSDGVAYHKVPRWPAICDQLDRPSQEWGSAVQGITEAMKLLDLVASAVLNGDRYEADVVTAALTAWKGIPENVLKDPSKQAQLGALQQHLAALTDLRGKYVTRNVLFGSPRTVLNKARWPNSREYWLRALGVIAGAGSLEDLWTTIVSGTSMAFDEFLKTIDTPATGAQEKVQAFAGSPDDTTWKAVVDCVPTLEVLVTRLTKGLEKVDEATSGVIDKKTTEKSDPSFLERFMGFVLAPVLSVFGFQIGGKTVEKWSEEIESAKDDAARSQMIQQYLAQCPEAQRDEAQKALTQVSKDPASVGRLIGQATARLGEIGKMWSDVKQSVISNTSPPTSAQLAGQDKELLKTIVRQDADYASHRKVFEAWLIGSGER